MKFSEYLEKIPYKVYDTKHFLERKDERHPQVNKKSILWMIDNAYKENLTNTEYLIFSKSLNFGIITKFTKNKFLIITVLPVGKQQPKENTIKVIVESYENKYSESFCEYISNFLNEAFDKNCDVENIKLKLNETKLETIFVDNKLYDIAFYNIIEVE
jgi:hypothetical protein